MIQMENLFSEDDSFPEERKPPLGASTPPGLPVTVEPKSLDHNRIEQLETEKEQLSASLFALTTRFAQIQFRLHQITEANPVDKDNLLKELEEFAHRGCVDHHAAVETCRNKESDINLESSQSLTEQHEAIINELKSQLNDLESFAYKQGGGNIPQSVQLEKQQALIKQLKQRLNLQVDDEDLATTSVDDLKSRVDDAVAEIVNPAKMKEKLVDHLQTQIQDLERFVEFLQGEAEVDGHKSSGSVTYSSDTGRDKKHERKESLASLRRALALIQMFSFTHFACGSKMAPEETMIVDTSLMIDQLKKAVIRVRTLSASRMRTCDGESSSCSSVSYSDDEAKGDSNETAVSDELTQAVRHDLCVALLDIISHGLVRDAVTRPGSVLMTPISCLLPRSLNPSYAAESMHPWELFLEYYEMKHGQDLAKNPSRMLTRAFNLEDLVSSGDDSRLQSTKSSLLEAIHVIVNDHNPLKRSYDAMFKAFVCLGLNAGRLSRWIRLVYRSTLLVSNHYNDSSYVARTGMEGVVTVLSKLDAVSFHLPVDVAVRPFKNIRDAF